MEHYMKNYCLKHKLLPEADLLSATGPEQTNESESVSFEAKLKLAKRIKQASFDVLARVVQVVEAYCKEALDDLDAERLQLRVSALDKNTLEKLSALLDRTMGEVPRKRPRYS